MSSCLRPDISPQAKVGFFCKKANLRNSFLILSIGFSGKSMSCAFLMSLFLISIASSDSRCGSLSFATVPCWLMCLIETEPSKFLTSVRTFVGKHLLR